MGKYKIGYTTGAFDMLHIGHLNIIRRSKQLCDHLIVGLSTDDLIRMTKNKAPIIPFDERKQILESLRYVDKVVPQDTYDKIQAWNILQYDVLTSGDDKIGISRWIGYERELAKVGVPIVFFPYTVITSSTLIREKLIRY